MTKAKAVKPVSATTAPRAVKTGALGAWLQKFLAQDPNKDGKVGTAKCFKGCEAPFDRTDANHDGVLTCAEVQAVLAKRHKPAAKGPAAKQG